jgi:hypothetical protein
MVRVGILHLHKYFRFRFSIDKKVVSDRHPAIWSGVRHWIDGLDEWIGAHHSPGSPVKALVLDTARSATGRKETGYRKGLARTM